jgi:hypothetical protein
MTPVMRTQNQHGSTGMEAHPARTLEEARKREPVRCSSLVDWPVYPRLRRTMRASTPARNPTKACYTNYTVDIKWKFSSVRTTFRLTTNYTQEGQVAGLSS